MNKDEEFLLWLAKRLVYKYGENKDILNIVETIIKKHQLIFDIFQENNNSIINDLETSMKISSKILNLTKNSMDKLRTELTKIKLHSLSNRFEDLDLDQLV